MLPCILLNVALMLGQAPASDEQLPETPALPPLSATELPQEPSASLFPLSQTAPSSMSIGAYPTFSPECAAWTLGQRPDPAPVPADSQSPAASKLPALSFGALGSAQGGAELSPVAFTVQDLSLLIAGTIPGAYYISQRQTGREIQGLVPAESEKMQVLGALGLPRRALPSPWPSPPFPNNEYQGYPLIGVPPDTTIWPFMQSVQGTWLGDLLNGERIRVYGWINASGNLSTSKHSNIPDSYWIVPNSFQMDQTILRVERQVDTVQTDHIDLGFRATMLYGIDYRYMTSGGWYSDQLLVHNNLYGLDTPEMYIDAYVPWVARGMILRVGRWIACPDIETQFAPDNYLVSHSLLFTFDTYTQTGIMANIMLNKQWMVQGAIEAGTDMAPWYKGAIPTGMFGVRWVALDNNDSIYTCLNNINNAQFRYFDVNGQPSGHDNFNYIVSTWQHRFNEQFFTKTEAYYMWQLNGVLGGTPSIGPVRSFGGGGGIGPTIPGLSSTYGVVNYTMHQLTKRDFIAFRNEYWRDEEGERSGFPSTYTSNTIGITHYVTPDLMIRPEIAYFRSWTVPAFDLGTRKNELIVGFDVTLRF